MTNEDCPEGIKNEKDIEWQGDKVAITFEHLNEGLEKLDKLNGKVWLILILVAATGGQNIWSMLMAVAK